MDFLHIDGKQVRHNAVVDHIAHQLAQLGFGADWTHEFVERHGVEMQVGPQRVQLERLIVNHRRSAVELHHVFTRSLGIHGHQKINFFLAADVPLLAGADGEPGGQPLNVRREHVLSRDGNAHLKNSAHQHAVRGLTAGTIDCCDLDAEIVDYGLLKLARTWRGCGNLNGRHLYARSFSGRQKRPSG